MDEEKNERISKNLLPIRQAQKDVFNLVFWQIESPSLSYNFFFLIKTHSILFLKLVLKHVLVSNKITIMGRNRIYL